MDLEATATGLKSFTAGIGAGFVEGATVDATGGATAGAAAAGAGVEQHLHFAVQLAKHFLIQFAKADQQFWHPGLSITSSIAMLTLLMVANDSFLDFRSPTTSQEASQTALSV